MATLSLDKTVFLFPHCMWEWEEGVGWVKNPKTISDHFSIYFVQFGTTLILSFDNFFSFQLCEGGGIKKNVKVISEQFSGNLEQVRWSKNPKLISDQFSLHSSQFGTTLFFFILTKFFFFWGGG